MAAPNRVWAGDITYLATAEGWLYLAVIIDLFSRRVVGWAIEEHMETSLVMGALEMAVYRLALFPWIRPGLIAGFGS